MARWGYLRAATRRERRPSGSRRTIFPDLSGTQNLFVLLLDGLAGFGPGSGDDGVQAEHADGQQGNKGSKKKQIGPNGSRQDTPPGVAPESDVGRDSLGLVQKARRIRRSRS